MYGDARYIDVDVSATIANVVVVSSNFAAIVVDIIVAVGAAGAIVVATNVM